jgi:hypothetical protein
MFPGKEGLSLLMAIPNPIGCPVYILAFQHD